jgi:hypothetical protein
MFCVCVAVAVVCIVAVGFSLITMDKTGVKEVPKALLEVASGNVRFTNSLYQVCGGCLADANVSSLMCVLERE